MKTYQDYLALCQEIWFHNKLYYIENRPELSDEEYDHLFKKLEELERLQPDWISSSSPTQRVGEALTQGFKTEKHRVPMLSLANTYSKDELADFIKRMDKLVESKNFCFSCEIKMDGIAISIRYEKGKFVQAVTRGNGKQGDDVTQNIKTIETLPLQLFGESIPEVLEVRGEVFLPRQVFEELNTLRASQNEELWANPRNAAAGSLKQLDPKEVAKRKLKIAFYGIAEISQKLDSQFQVHDILKQFGLPTLEYVEKCQNLDEIWIFAEKIRELRRNMPFDIDGIVIKLDDIKEQEKLGSTGKNPRWAVAYKFAAEQAVTRIRTINVQIGRTGVLTPVAELEPVFLAGSTIARATLHNQDEIDRKDIRIGDTVVIEKGGDVIPKVVNVVVQNRPIDALPWKMPSVCPNCASQVVRENDEVAVRCSNFYCSEQVLGRLIHFASKGAFDIENLGEKNMEQLFKKGFVKQFSDIFKLSTTELSQLEGFKDKSIQNLLKGIEQAKIVTLPRFIMGLGIKHVGVNMAEDLAEKAGSIQVLSKMTLEELLKIEGVGEKVAAAIVEFFSDFKNQIEVNALLEVGVTPHFTPVIKYPGHSFLDKTFVLTGSLERFSRAEAAALIKERGGNVTESVSKKTHFIVAGEAAGSKLDKAKKLGVPTLTENEFFQSL